MTWLKPHALNRVISSGGRTTLLGIDHGMKRIGLAITDPHWSFAFPLDVIMSDRNIAEVKKDVVNMCMENNVGGIVVGWPKLMQDDSEGFQCRRVAEFMNELQLDMFPKTLWNEGYTTELAKLRMQDQFEDRVAGLKRNRRRLKNPIHQRGTTFDAEAATELLREFLGAHGKHGRESTPDFLKDYNPERFGDL